MDDEHNNYQRIEDMKNARELSKLYHQYASLEELRVKITAPMQEVSIKCGSESMTFISTNHVKELVCIIDVEKSVLRTRINAATDSKGGTS